jgi:hypothetical protein
MNEHMTHAGAQFVGGVKVDRIVNDPTPVKKFGSQAIHWPTKKAMSSIPT